jgi:hypothetical protein
VTGSGQKAPHSVSPIQIFTRKMKKPKLIQLSLRAIGTFLLIGTCLAGQTDSPHGSSELRFRGAHEGWPSHDLQPIPLPNGRLVISIGDTVYLLDRDGRQVWKYKGTPLTTEPAYNESLSELAIVMHDLQAVRLSAATGEVLWKADAVGRGTYSRVCAYAQGFLVLLDMSGYRQSTKDSQANRLEYWGHSKKDFWYTDFPQASELVVNGRKIYAVQRGPGEILLQEIQVPRIDGGQ